jgi:sugar O-acyltransferase (sialic acid O-acetyltransferase NeuD family)
MRDLLLIGGGGHCKAVIDVIERAGEWRIAGIVDANRNLTDVSGYPLLGSDDDLPRLSRTIGHAFITLGQIKAFEVRAALYARLKQEGFSLPTIVSPLAEVSKRARLGEGTVIMHFASVGPAALVGYNTIINTKALVEHDSVVGNHCHVSTTAVLNGNVRVDDGTLIGSGTVIREGIVIGARCIVGMGSLVRVDLPPDSIYVEGKIP